MRHDTESTGADPGGAVPADIPERTRPAAGAPGDPGRAEDPAPAQAGAPSTGDARVDRVIAGLDRLDGLPTEAHVAVFEDVHATLRQVLSEIDSAAPDAEGR